ncbi:glutathione S-transferase family protein [Sneathiella chinensis]|uniref:Glutathione S-transferase n=1 Tax=Sneathiella chinensis TaxID=349750 RepID=A0ABQ5U046_9PROT|nr:glutathione S-transferase [Sneathiella chinensis]GLQ05524.1 glutathione S-transferase [Sneathiella chinensis]
MKLYDFVGPPSPRRVRMFLAEKGIDIEREIVNIREGEQFSPDFRAINNRCTIPALLLDDGTVLRDSETIQRYLEEVFPDPPLFGETPVQRAVINDWLRVIDLDGFGAVAEALRNSVGRLKDRALTGPHNEAQNPALAERGVRRIGYFFEELDRQLADHPYVAGETFSVADINALVVVDFAAMAQQTVPESCANIRRWYETVAARPSAKA